MLQNGTGKRIASPFLFVSPKAVQTEKSLFDAVFEAKMA
jgi:hypothetical protein